LRQSTVASISLFTSGQMRVVSLSAKAAQISSLCATDFDGMEETVPFSRCGVMVTFIIEPAILVDRHGLAVNHFFSPFAVI